MGGVGLLVLVGGSSHWRRDVTSGNLILCNSLLQLLFLNLPTSPLSSTLAPPVSSSALVSPLLVMLLGLLLLLLEIGGLVCCRFYRAQLVSVLQLLSVSCRPICSLPGLAKLYHHLFYANLLFFR